MKDFNLKEGDLVIVCYRTYERICKVEKITPSGLIKVDGTLFYKSGSERGGDVWSRRFLREATPQAIAEIKEKITIQKAIKLMRNTPKINLSQAEQIIEILEENKSNEAQKQ